MIWVSISLKQFGFKDVGSLFVFEGNDYVITNIVDEINPSTHEYTGMLIVELKPAGAPGPA